MSAPPATAGSLTAGDLAQVPEEIVAALRGARRVLTVCHENPEADALGAALGLGLALETLGATATVVCADPVPPLYGFMPAIGRFRTAPDEGAAYDRIVVVDCGELERVGPVLESQREVFERTPIVNIDHHKSNLGFGSTNWVDARAAATCEMLTLLVRAMGIPLTSAGGALAANLLSGIVMDTANFQHPNTTPRTLRAAAELVAAGAPLAETARRLYRTKPNEQLRLFGRVLARMESEADGRLVWSTLEMADLAATGALQAHSEGLIDLLSQSETAEVAILFKEADGQTRISVRTREGSVDATVLTGAFGGGGHARAAGATLELSPVDARPRVLAEARRLLDGRA